MRFMAGNLTYFSNKYAKYALPGCEFVIFLEHVCKMQLASQLASQQARQIEVLDIRNSGLGSRSFNI